MINDPLYFSRTKIIITTLFLTTHFTYFTMAPRILHIFNMFEPGGILIFPFTFLLSDVITEVYKYTYARFLMWCVILSLGIFTLFAWLSMQLPTAVLDYGYKAVFMNYPRLYFAIAIATLASFSINNTIISKLKIKFEGKRFWLRSLISTSIGHATFSIIWVTLFHWREISSFVLLKLILCMYLWKMSFEILATPMAAFLSRFIKTKEGVDPFDDDTNYNPFSM